MDNTKYVIVVLRDDNQTFDCVLLGAYSSEEASKKIETCKLEDEKNGDKYHYRIQYVGEFPLDNHSIV